MKRLLPVLAACLLAALSCERNTHYTVIVSLDGNRWDYPQLYDLPFFDSLATVGVAAAIERGEIPAGRIRESAARIRRMKGKM